MEFRADALERAARIRMVVMDVDGTMTCLLYTSDAADDIVRV